MNTSPLGDSAIIHSTFKTRLYADCVECVPHNQLPSYISVGTYQLEDGASQRRIGERYLLKVESSRQLDSDKSEDTTNLPCQDRLSLYLSTLFPITMSNMAMDSVNVESKSMAGILDLKWNQNLCALALADGTIALERLHSNLVQDPNNFVETAAHCGGSYFDCGSSISVDAISTILLSLDWSPSSANATTIVASSQNGRVYIVPIDKQSFIPNTDISTCSITPDIEQIKAHDMEIWHVSYSRDNPNTIYTGSDDGTFKAWDLLDPNTFSSTSTRPTVTNRYHSAGICSIQAHPSRTHCIASASYDKSLCLWDSRNFTEPVWKQTVESGVWRLRWNPTVPSHILAAAMHDGFYVFDIDKPVSSSTVAHLPTASIAYGCDWVGNSTMATCSFYDNTVQLWSVR